MRTEQVSRQCTSLGVTLTSPPYIAPHIPTPAPTSHHIWCTVDSWSGTQDTFCLCLCPQIHHPVCMSHAPYNPSWEFSCLHVCTTLNLPAAPCVSVQSWAAGARLSPSTDAPGCCTAQEHQTGTQAGSASCTPCAQHSTQHSTARQHPITQERAMSTAQQSVRSQDCLELRS
jgi:hypothetical protein